jgi:hypothetical protein
MGCRLGSRVPLLGHQLLLDLLAPPNSSGSSFIAMQSSLSSGQIARRPAADGPGVRPSPRSHRTAELAHDRRESSKLARQLRRRLKWHGQKSPAAGASGVAQSPRKPPDGGTLLICRKSTKFHARQSRNSSATPSAGPPSKQNPSDDQPRWPDWGRKENRSTKEVYGRGDSEISPVNPGEEKGKTWGYASGVIRPVRMA